VVARIGARVAGVASALGVIGTLGAGCAGGAPKAPEAPSCAGGGRLFDPKGPARVLVATFAGRDPATSAALSRQLETELRKFDQEHPAERAGAMFQVASVPDVLRGHDAARACAEKLGADLVLWGTVEENPQPRVGDVHTDVRVGTVETGSHSNVSIGNVTLGAKPFSFLPSVTLRRRNRWIMTSSRLDLFSLADVDFNAIGLNGALFLVPFVAGASALERSEFGRARAMFELAKGRSTSTGEARTYAATFLGAVKLSGGEGKAAAEALDVAQGDLERSPALLQWHNRVLLGRAREDIGDLRGARDAFATADALGAGLEPRFSAIAPAALTWVQVHLGDAGAALATVERALAGAAAPCVQSTIACGEATANKFRLVVIKIVALRLLGLSDEASQCERSMKAETERWIGDYERERAREKRAESEVEPESIFDAMQDFDPERPPGMLQVVFNQLPTCVMVHWPEIVGAGLSSAENSGRRSSADDPTSLFRSSADDLVREFDESLQGRGMFGPVFFLMPVRLRPQTRAGVACSLALIASYKKDFNAAHILAAKAEQQLSANPPLMRLEAGLVHALADARQGRRDKAAERVRTALPLLREAMGPDAPTVRRWERFVTLGELRGEPGEVPPHVPCR
jgi:hypothetical protein